ncbi:hypothetical protein J2Z22_004230 [Paenibacillus forsythiae]|uniref:Uncharacterized protein n=1 Tax=Paenibacillus forsythiae TaxID=365616 RepID=A0ABU3HCU2_9BACL|nr:hypothetical protein [Paenibacillus forsythiae]MDT3428637.1 hypothetical protein [Paenibacillus forsythiae]
MSTAAVVAFYVAVFLWGLRRLRGKGSGPGRLLFGCILGWAAYVNISGIAMIPHLSISSLYIAYFQPVGAAIIRWLGG